MVPGAGHEPSFCTCFCFRALGGAGAGCSRLTMSATSSGGGSGIKLSVIRGSNLCRAEGIQTDGHRGRSEISSYSRLPLKIAVRLSTPVSNLGRDYRAKAVPAEAISPGSRAATASRTVTRRMASAVIASIASSVAAK